MNLSSLTLLKVLLERSEKKEELLPLLSEKEKDQLQTIALQPLFFVPEDFIYDRLLAEVHYSWFIPTLKSYSKREACLFLMSLPSSCSEKISSLLPLQPLDAKLSKSAKKFFRKMLLDSLLGEEKEILPKNYLPPSPLNVLTTIPKNQLLRLIDFLALYDLAIELRTIVATSTLKKISDFLSKDEEKFLRSKMSIKEPFHLPPLGLKKWDETKDSLRHLLHSRGLIRLAKALSIQHEHLIWYICHRLDIGRGNLLFRMANKKEDHEIANRMISYVEEITSLLKHKKEEKS